MRKRPADSTRTSSSPDVHDIRSLTATGRITLPYATTSGRKSSTADPESSSSR
jgi:hypothetical protein